MTHRLAEVASNGKLSRRDHYPELLLLQRRHHGARARTRVRVRVLELERKDLRGGDGGEVRGLGLGESWEEPMQE